MHLVTGGSGFIGSNIVSDLLSRGERVAVCDVFGSDDKWKNLQRHDVADLVAPEDLSAWLETHGEALSSVLHMGAISATTATDVDLIIKTNFTLSKQLWQFCAEAGLPFIYASSAATYGDGQAGFDDASDAEAMARLRPLNPYGWSKHVFDRWALSQARSGRLCPPKWAGLKFFNVYGPNEYHKGSMKSVIAQNYDKIANGAPMQLFRSYRDDYADGGQMRDFVYVEDCTQVIAWMLTHDMPSDIYNIGSGQARSWIDLAHAMFKALGMVPNIEFIDMPEAIRDRYQYFTEANISKLRKAGYEAEMTSLEDGVERYIVHYLQQADRFR